jgi:hypothetical protein
MFTKESVLEHLKETYEKVTEELDENEEHIEHSESVFETEALRHHRQYLSGKASGLLLAISRIKKIK